MEGKVENRYNGRVCSRVQGILWVGYWRAGGKQYVQSDLLCTIDVIDGSRTAEVAYHGVLHHPQQSLIHRVRPCDHHQASPLG